jgi:hypothetical protein
MASNAANITWSSWSLSTKVGVAFGLVLATALVVFLYLPH